MAKARTTTARVPGPSADASPNSARRDLTTRVFTLCAETIDEQSRSVEATLATEAPTQVWDWERYLLIEEILVAGGARFGRQVPMLETHSRWSLDDVLGSVRSMRREPDQVAGRLFFAEGDERAERAWQKVRQGHVTDVSVGYRIDESVDIAPNKSAEVDGRTYQAGPSGLRVTTKWRIREVSLVPVGADEYAKIREEAAADGGGATRDTDNEGGARFGAAPAAGSGTATEEQPSMAKEREAPQAPETQPVATPGPETQRVVTEGPDRDAVSREAQEAERKRQGRIREMAGADVPRAIVVRALDEGWDEARAGVEFLAAIREQARPAVEPDRQRIHVGVDHGVETFRAALVDAVLMTHAQVRVEAPDRQRLAEPFRGIGLHDLARICVEHETRAAPAFDPQVLFKRAISTGSFPEILGTSATKRLHAAYEETPSTILAWADTRDVPDFKTYREIRLGALASSLPEVGNAGELDSGTISETVETYSALTRGLRFAVTRKLFINDDMGAFLRIPMMLGQAARRTIDDVGYALLISASGLGPTMNEDSQTLFYASRTTPNYATGSGTALGDDALSAGKKLMRLVKGLAGETLNLNPLALLVPAALQHTAQKLVTSSEIMLAKAGTTDATTYLPTANIHQNTLRVIVEPRLDAGTNGTTAWYLVAPPSQAASLVVVFLRGNRLPIVERKDPVDVLGLGWWVYHDVGVAAVDWRGINRAAGA